MRNDTMQGTFFVLFFKLLMVIFLKILNQVKIKKKLWKQQLRNRTEQGYEEYKKRVKVRWPRDGQTSKTSIPGKNWKKWKSRQQGRQQNKPEAIFTFNRIIVNVNEIMERGKEYFQELLIAEKRDPRSSGETINNSTNNGEDKI